MPIIQVNMLEGRTTEQKRAMAEKMADAVVEALGVKHDQVRILVHEMGPEDYSVGGKTATMRGLKPPPA